MFGFAPNKKRRRGNEGILRSKEQTNIDFEGLCAMPDSAHGTSVKHIMLENVRSIMDQRGRRQIGHTKSSSGFCIKMSAALQFQSRGRDGTAHGEGNLPGCAMTYRDSEKKPEDPSGLNRHIHQIVQKPAFTAAV